MRQLHGDEGRTSHLGAAVSAHCTLVSADHRRGILGAGAVEFAAYGSSPLALSVLQSASAQIADVMRPCDGAKPCKCVPSGRTAFTAQATRHEVAVPRSIETGLPSAHVHAS